MILHGIFAAHWLCAEWLSMILIYLIDSGSADIIFHWWPTGAYCRLWLLLPFLPMPPFRVFTFIFLVISIIASSLSDNPFLRHGSFNILTWKFKVKVRHRWCKMSESYYASYWFISLSLNVKLTTHSCSAMAIMRSSNSNGKVVDGQRTFMQIFRWFEKKITQLSCPIFGPLTRDIEK